MKRYRNIFTTGGVTPIRGMRFLERDCGPDGFRISVDAAGGCEIAYTNARGKRYALREAETLKTAAPVGRLEDRADFVRRGIVEGYYGKPYTHADRKDLLDFMDSVRMNLYLYAPKDDPFHRDCWREPYPTAKLTELRDLAAYARRREIDFCYCISPGLDMRFADESEFARLIEKLRALEAVGITEFALLFDDIRAELKAEDAARFGSAAEAQAHVAARVREALGKEILFCPTDYWQDTDTPYRADIKRYLPADTAVMWTGYNTVAEYIDEDDGERARAYFGHELLLWDNYPVNDFMTERLFLGALRNRGQGLCRTHSGMVMNPMDRPQLSKFALHTAAAYMWNAAVYDPEEAEAAAAAYLVPDAPADALRLVRDNASSALYDSGEAADPIGRECAYARLKEKLPEKLRVELNDYFAYAALECRAYEAALSGRDIAQEVAQLNESGIRTAYNEFDRFLEREKPAGSEGYRAKKTRRKYRTP